MNAHVQFGNSMEGLIAAVDEVVDYACLKVRHEEERRLAEALDARLRAVYAHDAMIDRVHVVDLAVCKTKLMVLKVKVAHLPSFARFVFDPLMKELEGRIARLKACHVAR